MRLGILLSGRGSNMRALVAATREGRIAAEIGLVLSNVAGADGIRWAADERLPVATLPHRDYPDRAEHDRAVAAELKRSGIDLVCLAGYMRLLGAELLTAFPGAILNIHPSLLPAFPGVEAQRQAWEYGAKVTGATVHYVDAELDHGPILAQEAIAVDQDESLASLTERILAVEHRLYPHAVALACSGKVTISGRRVHIEGHRS